MLVRVFLVNATFYSHCRLSWSQRLRSERTKTPHRLAQMPARRQLDYFLISACRAFVTK